MHQHAQHTGDVQFRGIHDDGIGSGTQGRHGPVAVQGVTLADLLGQRHQIGFHPAGGQVAQTAQGAHFGRSIQKEFEAGVRKDHRAHVTAFHHQRRGFAHGPLGLAQHLAHHGHRGDAGGQHAHLLGAHFAADGHAVAAHRGGPSLAGQAEGPLAALLAQFLFGQGLRTGPQLEGQATEHGAGIQISHMQAFGQLLGQRGLAHTGGAVQGHHRQGRLHPRTSCIHCFMASRKAVFSSSLPTLTRR